MFVEIALSNSINFICTESALLLLNKALLIILYSSTIFKTIFNFDFLSVFLGNPISQLETGIASTNTEQHSSSMFRRTAAVESFHANFAHVTIGVITVGYARGMFADYMAFAAVRAPAKDRMFYTGVYI